jgi:Phage integrase family
VGQQGECHVAVPGRKLLKKAGVPAAYRVHDLRHTAGSHLLAEGVPLAEVSQILGHANPAITARQYAHAVKRTRGATFRQLGDYYRRAAADGEDPMGSADAEPESPGRPDRPGTDAGAGGN